MIPFSWSKRRQALWDGCRFGYYLYYYGGYGGFDPDAPRDVRRIHELKYLMSAHEYGLRLLAQAVRDNFYRPDDAPFRRNLFPALQKRFRREFGRMLAGAWQVDHKIPMLLELRYGECPAREMRDQLEDELRRACARLECELVPALENVGRERRRPFSVPLPVQINDLTCYIAPWVMLSDGGTLCIIDAAGDDTTLLLHRYYALNEWRIPPDRVRSLQILPASGELREVGDELNIGMTVQRLLHGAQQMRNALRSDGTAHPEDFPRNREHCATCRFRDYCGTK